MTHFDTLMQAEAKKVILEAKAAMDAEVLKARGITDAIMALSQVITTR